MHVKLEYNLESIPDEFMKAMFDNGDHEEYVFTKITMIPKLIKA